MNTALEYCTRVVQEGGRRCKKSTLNDLVHLTPLRIPLMNPPYVPASSDTVESEGRQMKQSFLNMSSMLRNKNGTVTFGLECFISALFVFLLVAGYFFR
jgi:hypothetical protein